MSAPARFAELINIMARLRDPENGCPWDLKQDFHSIAPYTLEEAYEVADAIERNDMDELCGELGDLLLQVVYHAQMAAEQGSFTIDQVVERINAKMTSRHPHVFGDAELASAEAVTERWNQIKAQERAEQGGHDSHLSGIAQALPALKRSHKLQRRAAEVGFDWPDETGIWDKLAEEIAELKAAHDAQDAHHMEEEIGDLLFTVVNLARHLNIKAETALRRANRKFEQRFRAMEQQAGGVGKRLSQMTLEELDALWDGVKTGS